MPDADQDTDRALKLDAFDQAPASRRTAVTPSRPAGREAVISALVQAAAAEFAALGFRAASVRSIAARAQVNHGMIARHFGSKGALLQSVLKQLASENAVHSLADRTVESFLSRPSFRLEQQIIGRVILEGIDPTALPTSLPVYDVLGPAIAGRFGLTPEEGRIAVAALKYPPAGLVNVRRLDQHRLRFVCRGAAGLA